MPSEFSKDFLISKAQRLIELWRGKTPDTCHYFFSENILIETSHRGGFSGKREADEWLKSDFADADVSGVILTNIVTRASQNKGIVTAYFYGDLSYLNRKASFGGVILLEVNADGEVCEVRIHLNWFKGNKFLLKHWYLPTESYWKQGDRPAAVISEYDAPWYRIPHSKIIMSDRDNIEQAWYRYAWSLDLADFHLFRQSFSPDAEGNFMPVGYLKGRRNIVTSLKAFRQPWPWMQHYGSPLLIEVSLDRESAKVIIGRIIPEHTHEPDGQSVWGAHYEIHMLRCEDGDWQLSWSEYVPRWIRASDATMLANGL